MSVELGYLLPSIAALERGSKTMHAAVMTDVAYPPFGPEDTFRYPALIAVCGVQGWGEGRGPVTCKRCLRFMEHPEKINLSPERLGVL